MVYRLPIRPAALIFSAALSISTVCACAGGQGAGEGITASAPIREVLKKNTDRLLAIPGVVGTAIGEAHGTPCILVLVKQKDPAIEKQIPAELDGYPVVVQETGALRPLTNNG
jgi:hypothetical protein